MTTEEARKLLGLPEGDVDPKVIEETTMRLYEEARSRQMVDPEGASERMNQLVMAKLAIYKALPKAETITEEEPSEDESRAAMAAGQTEVVADTNLDVAEPRPEVGTDSGLATILADTPAPTDPLVQGASEGISEATIPTEPSESVEDAEPAATTLAEPLKEAPGKAETPKQTAKKKPKVSAWPSLLHGLGAGVSQLGHSFGMPHLGKIGGMIQGVGTVMKMADMLGVHFGQSPAEGRTGAAPAAEGGGAAEVAQQVLTGGTEGAGEADDTGLASTIPSVMDTISHGGAPAAQQAQAPGGDGNTEMRELIDAIKKLTEQLEKQQHKPGKEGGDFMPEGGSLGSAAMGGIAEALGLAPGELQLILTMFRMAAMLAA